MNNHSTKKIKTCVAHKDEEVEVKLTHENKQTNHHSTQSPNIQILWNKVRFKLLILIVNSKN